MNRIDCNEFVPKILRVPFSPSKIEYNWSNNMPLKVMKV